LKAVGVNFEGSTQLPSGDQHSHWCVQWLTTSAAVVLPYNFLYIGEEILILQNIHDKNDTKISSFMDCIQWKTKNVTGNVL
jgi:hypothetical protein